MFLFRGNVDQVRYVLTFSAIFMQLFTFVLHVLYVLVGNIVEETWTSLQSELKGKKGCSCGEMWTSLQSEMKGKKGCSCGEYCGGVNLHWKWTNLNPGKPGLVHDRVKKGYGE